MDISDEITRYAEILLGIALVAGGTVLTLWLFSTLPFESAIMMWIAGITIGGIVAALCAPLIAAIFFPVAALLVGCAHLARRCISRSAAPTQNQ